MQHHLYHLRRLALSHALEKLLRRHARRLRQQETPHPGPAETMNSPQQARTPEDFRPLQNACFQDPYAFYRMLRDDYPVYRLPNGIYCISRYQDIVKVSRDTDNYSSTHQGAVAGLRPGHSIIEAGRRLERLGNMGIVPADVMALSDPPKHTGERKIGHKALNARFVKSLEADITTLCRNMMDDFIDTGKVEFMQEFGWRLPMKLIIKLLGFPAEDFERIKAWCVHGIATQSGISTKAEMAAARAEMLSFNRYCWRRFLLASKQPRDDLTGLLVRTARDPNNPFDDKLAVATIAQLLIAGSDSSATSMGNAIKLLIENPDIQTAIRQDSDKLPAFVEEVFRLESAFQGHFRWTKNDCELHGIKLPRESRIFLMWASGNRDERVFERPDEIDLNRNNGKKHLTFGHGVHACIGRELARSEIRIVLAEFMRRTEKLRIDGDCPFLASMFARTLVRLPIAFDAVDADRDPVEQAA